ncbi:MAG: type II toxin-antitoxin system RelE/ParE family toxin [Candidatus Magnetominusculus sp. LBB02]|nr:type II toxin-antitoxin system RelE/ParE family toxin [Candidatus Magnetominusculus sp. LBB02]
MLPLYITRQVKNFLATLDAKQYAQITRKIFSLLEDGTANDAKKLQGYDYLRVDAGHYRIIYKVENNCVYVALAGKRNDGEIYKALK